MGDSRATFLKNPVIQGITAYNLQQRKENENIVFTSLCACGEKIGLLGCIDTGSLYMSYIVNVKIDSIREGPLVHTHRHIQHFASHVARPLMLGWCPKEALK